MSDDPSYAVLDSAVAAFEKRPIQSRLITAAGRIGGAPPGGDLAFLHTALCQVYLPTRRPAPGTRTWDRRNGEVSITVEAGRAYSYSHGDWQQLPLPWGPKARLALIGLTSTAVGDGKREVNVNRSLTRFTARLIGRAPGGRDVIALRHQLAALIVATFRLGWSADGVPTQMNSQIASVVEGLDPAAWAITATQRGRWPWPRSVHLAPAFFDAVAEHSVPLDPRALAALGHTALGLDIYVWLAQRLCRLRRPQFVPWSALAEQFSSFGRLRDFRPHFLGTLATVARVYDGARLVVEETSAAGTPAGLRLFPAAPPVPRTATAVPALRAVDNRGAA